jgi:hypothetical protein
VRACACACMRGRRQTPRASLFVLCCAVHTPAHSRGGATRRYPKHKELMELKNKLIRERMTPPMCAPSRQRTVTQGALAQVPQVRPENLRPGVDRCVVKWRSRRPCSQKRHLSAANRGVAAAVQAASSMSSWSTRHGLSTRAWMPAAQEPRAGFTATRRRRCPGAVLQNMKREVWTPEARPPLHCKRSAICSGVSHAHRVGAPQEIARLRVDLLADKQCFLLLWVGSAEGLEEGRTRWPRCAAPRSPRRPATRSGRNLIKRWGFRRCEDIAWWARSMRTEPP